MKRLIWIAILVTVAALAGCSGQQEQKPQVVPVSGPEDDAYQTAVYAQARAEWEEKAAQGDMQSQRQLGVMYLLGQGIDPDYELAIDWFNKAAAQGEDIAQYQLGFIYAEGKGVEPNNVEAHMWFSLAAEQGNANARIRLDALTTEMTTEEIADAQKLADEWTPTI